MMNNKTFELDNESQNILNARMVLALFDIFLKQKKISKREYELIKMRLNCTFNNS